MEWHSKSKEEIFEELKVSKEGLTSGQAAKRIRELGPNQISKKKKTPLIFIFLKQFNSPLIYVLFVAMIISFVFGHLVDAYVILTIVLINATIGFIQERKAEKAIDALKKLIVSYAKVYRNNQLIKVPSENLVPGDLIFLEEGDKIPADARLIEMKNFRTQEASLTGESFPVEKDLKILEKSVPLADRINMVFMGTLVVSGEAKAIVVETGNSTAVDRKSVV